MTNRTLLLTGATGIMGSWVLGEALSRGYSAICLMRDATHAAAVDRIKAVLGHVDHAQDLHRVQVVLGEASHPGLGLSQQEAEEVRAAADLMIHCAACTTFSPDQDAEVWATNVDGVRNVVSFLAGSGVPLYHVSTAYVAGKRQGRVLETELSIGQEFNNTYERSKLTSETMVRTAFSDGSLSGAIFRPSIITGSTRDGRIMQFMNFYNVLRMIDLIAHRRMNGSSLLRVAARPDGTKNLIPVDWAIQALWRIIEREGPSNQVYHLTNPNPMPHTELAFWANEMVRETGLRIELVDRIDGTPSSLEALFAAGFSNYLPYMQTEPLFDRTNTDRALNGEAPFPAFTPAYFQLLLDYAREARWKSLFERELGRRRREASGASVAASAPTLQKPRPVAPAAQPQRVAFEQGV